MLVVQEDKIEARMFLKSNESSFQLHLIKLISLHTTVVSETYVSSETLEMDGP
jgi:hypothetical protein